MSAASSPTSAPAPVFSRRRLLAASSAGLALLVAGCTSSSDATPARDQVTDRQVDALAAQVTVQEGVVAAYQAVTAADAALGARVAELAGQAGTQLARLKAASPTRASSGSAPGSSSQGAAASGSTAAGPPAGTAPAAWLLAQVTAAADSHASACLGQSGARAALLGSIAAGLRSQAGRLA